MRYQQIVLFFFVLLTSWVQAQVIHDIKVEGINVLNRSVIIKQLNIKVKDDVTEADLNLAMKHMYHSGLYDRVELSIEQGVLKVQVAENPVIRKVVIHGGKELKDDQKESLKNEYSIKKGKILRHKSSYLKCQKIIKL